MKNNIDIESKVLLDSQIDQLIARKIEQEIKQEKELAQLKREAKKVTVTDFSLVPADKIFCPETTYLVYNRKAATESFINGIQAESFVAMRSDIRHGLETHAISAFSSGDYYIIFKHYIGVADA